MGREPVLRPTVWDAVIVLAVAGLAVTLFLLPFRVPASADGTPPLTAVVVIDGTLAERVELGPGTAAERDYTGNGLTLHAVFTEGGAQVTHSECPTQVCVHTGRVTHRGQSIICLPAGITITLEGGTDTGVDAYLP